MKNLKKLGAIVLALVMVLSLSVTAFAATGTQDGEFETGDAPKPAVVDPKALDNAQTADGYKTLTFKVEFNPETGLTTPAYTFTYTVAPIPAAIPAGTGPEVKPGVGSITVPDAVFAAGETEKEITIDINSLDFTAAGAGIYRYVITQAKISADGVKAGILNDKGTAAIEVRYLDLYVDKDAKVVGAVLFKADGSGNGAALPAVNANNEVSYSGKVDSFVNTFGKPGSDQPDPDDPTPPGPDYPDPTEVGKHTVILTKAIEGNMASKTQEFPFELTMASDGLDLTGVKCTIEVNANTPNLEVNGGNVTKTTVENVTTYTLDFAAASNIYKIALKGADSVKITVPNNVTFKVQEKIQVGEGYTVTDAVAGATLDTGFAIQDKTEGQEGAQKSDVNGLQVKLLGKDQNPTFTYTNTRSAISPTGVVLTFAPYFFMMAAAIVLVLFTRRREEEQA